MENFYKQGIILYENKKDTNKIKLRKHIISTAIFIAVLFFDFFRQNIKWKILENKKENQKRGIKSKILINKEKFKHKKIK